ncbi:cytochrome P450 [Thamnocephalis sphaerospora]|uniref:Cytochrome P450 n=1 Tax=Thamnocephalis sphaerospora TaxID=78915 RepID=A0A4P9XXC0_9FUNG|nr:cytochrome P450 [Thamnocephalis sphaerospora]|eukprot:RKP10100.1 cytochrome P450 [Thamnocephalis sphaerospora]
MQLIVPEALSKFWQSLPLDKFLQSLKPLEELARRTTPKQAVAALVLAYAAHFAVFRVIFAPLRHIRGPAYTRFSNLPFISSVKNGRQIYDYCEARKKYGKVARMGANIVSVVDPAALKIIYNSHNFRKGAVYDALDWFGPNIFSARDPEFHKQRRRAVYPSYSPAAVNAMEPVLYETGPRALAAYIEQYAEAGQVFDIMQELQLMRIDEVGATTFGQKFDLIHQRTHPLLGWVTQTLHLGMLQMWFPLLRRIPVPQIFSSHYRSRANLRAFVVSTIEQRRRVMEKKRDTLQVLLDAQDTDGQKLLGEQELVSELAIQLVVGNFPVSLTLLWTINQLLENPDTLKQLMYELDHALPDPNNITDNKLVHLPYLDAVIRESMRHRPVMAEGLPRVVPKGGCQISGQFIPEGTVVFVSAYALHHEEELWHDPETFRPERWLGPAEQVNEIKKAYIPFSTGVRSCAGQRFAWMLMRLTLATLLRRFTFEAMPNQNMKPAMAVFMVPAGGKYMVRATKRA